MPFVMGKFSIERIHFIFLKFYGIYLVVNSLFIVAPIVCEVSVFALWFVAQYLVSCLVLQSSRRKRAGCFTLIIIVFLVSWGY